MVKKHLFLLFLSLLASGCALYDYRTGDPLPGSLNVTELSDDINGSRIVCKELPGPHPCYCVLCENKTSWDLGILNFLNPFFDSSLKGGNCSISHCNISTAVQVIKEDENVQLRTFMLGHGPTFTAGDLSNIYCNYSNQLAVTWLLGANGIPPQVPQSKRAACWLERNIIPIYIYNTQGTAIDPARTGQIASALADAGPVIITSEINFNSSDASAVQAVKQQIYQIKRNCPKCLSVLAVKSGDLEGVRAVLEDPSPSYGGKNISSLVDLVGFGFLANDYPDCNVNRIIGYNLAFSRFILRNYSKPTIWLYVGASEGGNANGVCTFSPGAVREFYQSLFTGIQGFASSGVIGMAFYEFSDRSGPLPCPEGRGCEFGVLSSSGLQKHPHINTWAELCRYYTQVDYRSPLVFSRNAQGIVCDFLQNWKMYQIASVEVNTNLGLSNEQVIPLPRKKKLHCGEICVSDIPLQKPDIYNSYQGASFSGSCSRYPAIEDYSDDFEISSVYMRALIQQESGFDPWVVSCSPTPCNIPANTTMDQLCQMAGYSSGCSAHTLNRDNDKTCPPSAPYFCAMGLAQCTRPPGDSLLSRECAGGSSYDPFNASQSICCGARELRQRLAQADSFLQANWEKLSECPYGMTQDEYGWAKYYLAANMYYGGPAIQHLSSFLSQRDANGKCSGQQHYIKYLRESFTRESIPGLRDSEYGAKQLTIYLDALGDCQSDCPGAIPGGLAVGETGDMRIFGHSLAQESFKGKEAQVQQMLSERGVRITVNPTISRSGQTIAETTNNVRNAGQHKAIVLYTGANDLHRSEEEIKSLFSNLFSEASRKAQKVYVFNIIEFGSQAQWAKISRINSYLRNYASSNSQKFVLIDINQHMSTLGPGCPYRSGNIHGCYVQTREFFVQKVAENPPSPA
ncbi:MAG: hypothetical protein N3F07_03280 [Candidatus Micrarchaeota archaeon]|nr:hypothetical protein [Candidatus Micrarchaeota archaeon]